MNKGREIVVCTREGGASTTPILAARCAAESIDKIPESLILVPGVGLEPTRLLSPRILSPLRLPIPSPGQFDFEARVGIEPTHKSFADSCLTTWLPGLILLIKEQNNFIKFF